ncbi:hypothetical protein SLS53_007702 [Cytospora paraplurivora]|uniref:Calcium channel YVC1-like C-terminal transmembrane domain-containing protein n=1 Tax=Cytospora paraplurivora TaxID=2898453 RepID=A0AAN9U1Z4_9PEZI
MPMRVKSRPQPGANDPPRSPSPLGVRSFGSGLPDIQDGDSFRELIKELSIYINHVVVLPVTFEQLRTTSAGEGLRTLVEHLSRGCSNPAIVNALLALKWHYGAATEDKSVNDARANAAEIVAWRFLTHLSEREAVDYCLYEIPEPKEDQADGRARDDDENGRQSEEVDENTALLAQTWPGTFESAKTALTSTGTNKRYQLLKSISRLTITYDEDEDEDQDEDPTKPFVTLNALEIAAVADAKRFLSQHVVQKIITGIWHGDIVFWDKLAVDSVKRPRFYSKATTDPFSRLRVPRYLKTFEVVFFMAFLFLYYTVLVERNPEKISVNEVLLYIWFAAFSYDELSEYVDAGSIFYATDTLNQMALYLTKIFYGSSYVGFDIMNDIDPSFGPPLMIIFITLSSFLLMGSLTGMLSNSFSRVISHAREEYLYVYSVYVLEASTSNRLTHFYPPFNLLALMIFRPLRLFLPSDRNFRAARIILLKATHLPIVGAIMLYELIRGKVTDDEYCGFKGPRQGTYASAATASSNDNKGTPRRKPSSIKVRPSSAPLPVVDAGADAANDDVDAPTEMDVRIAELSGKIDRLTEIILSMQREREASHHTE